MYFKNFTFFRFPSSLDFNELETGLSECRLKPVGDLELQSVGFVSPLGKHSTDLSRTIANVTWLTVGSQTRVLPPAAVNNALDDRVAAIEEKEGRMLGSAARRRVKEDLVHEMLPRAFVKPGRTDAILMPALGLLMVDTASRKTAEGVVSMIRHALGSFPALPLNAEKPVRQVLTDWLREGHSGSLPADINLGEEAELRSPHDAGAIVKLQRHELERDQVIDHLDAGMQVSRLGVTVGGRNSFVMSDDLVVRKFQLLDGVVDSLDTHESEDLLAELDARFVLMTGEARSVFNVLSESFRFSTAQ